MIVVSDTSPILNLWRIGRLELLTSLYGQVLIPPAVFAELTAKADDVPVVDVDSISWLTIGTPKDQTASKSCCANWTQVRPRQSCLNGLIGILAEAKRAGLIKLVKPVLDDLIQIARFWIGPELYGEVLSELGEG